MATKVELFELIRRDSWHGGLSVRALAGKYGVHRRLVREALMHAEPDPRKTPERRSARLEPFKAVIDGWLRADLDAPRKQRHTATRVHARLLDEHGAGDVSYAAVRDYVARRWRRSASRKAAARRRCSIPQHHPPAWRPRSTSGSCGCGWPGCWSSATCSRSACRIPARPCTWSRRPAGQEAFLEGHVHAFTVLGGVPAGQIRYDNLTPAVTRVLRKGRAEDREPAVDGVPVALPVRGVLLRARHRGRAREGRRRGPGRVLPPQLPGPGPGSGLPRRTEPRGSRSPSRPRTAAGSGARICTIGQDFAAEAPRLVPPPDEPFETGLPPTPRVDRDSQVHRADEPLLRAGAADRPPGAGRLRSGAGHLRRAARGRPSPADDRQGRRDTRPGPLPGGADAPSPEPSPGWSRWTRPAPPGRSPARMRRCGQRPAARTASRRDPRPGRGPAAAPAHGRRRRRHRDPGNARRSARTPRRRRRGRGPPGRRRPRRRPFPDSGGGSLREEPQVTSLTLRRLAALPADTRPLPTVSAYDQLARRGPRTSREGQS